MQSYHMSIITFKKKSNIIILISLLLYFITYASELFELYNRYLLFICFSNSCYYGYLVKTTAETLYYIRILYHQYYTW